MPRIGLFAHRTVIRGATGIGFYVRRFTAAMSRLEGTDGFHFQICATAESDAAGVGEESLVSDAAGLPVVRAKGSRWALYGSWALTGRPRMDPAFRRPDLLHVLYPATPVPMRVPTVYTVHDLMPLKSPEWYGRSERWAFERGIRYAARRAERLLANSHSTARELVDRLDVPAEKITVVYHAADEAFFRPVDPTAVQQAAGAQGLQPGTYVIALGAVSRRKGLPTLLEAVAQTGSSLPDLRLVAVGPPGDGYDEITEQVRRLGLDERVRFTGWLPTTSMMALLAGARALVHPSLDEGFGTTPIEAMAAGVPSIVSDSGSLPEVTAGAALVVPAGEAGEWAEAIRRVWEDDDLREKLIDQGKDRAATFSWSRTAEASLEVYRQVLGTCGG